MNFSSPNANDRPATAGAGVYLAPSRVPRARFFFSQNSKTQKLFLTLLLGVLSLWFSASSAPAAFVYFQFTTATGAANTNWFKITQCSATANADGTYTTLGIPIRITPNSSGYAVTNLQQNNYLVTNALGGPQYVIRVPLDSGPTLYNGSCTYFTCTNGLIISSSSSGLNTFVTIEYGTNPPPTYNEITNSLGFLPASITQLNTASNHLQTNLTANLTTASNGLQAQITSATNSGITAATATNISRQMLVTMGAITNGYTGTASIPTIAGATANISAITAVTVTATALTGLGTGVTEIPYANLTTAARGSITNAALGADLNATNKLDTDLRALVTATTNGLNTRLLDTNTSLLAQLNTTSNTLYLSYTFADLTIYSKISETTNGLNTRLLNTNSALTDALNATNNALVTRLIATNDLLEAHIIAATNNYNGTNIMDGSIRTNEINPTFYNFILAQASSATGNGIVTNNGSGTNNYYVGSTNENSRVTNGTIINPAFLGTDAVGNPLSFYFANSVIGRFEQEWPGQPPSGTLGFNNANSSPGAYILGSSNIIAGYQPYSVISGGRSNVINGVTNNSFWRELGGNVIAGGFSNLIDDVSGGSFNARNVIGGGSENKIYDNGGDNKTIGGGFLNIISNSAESVIAGGGFNNIIGPNWATIAGGQGNSALRANGAGSIYGSSILGGYGNLAGSNYSTVLGGARNYAMGEHSTVAGLDARSTNTGTFVYADASGTAFNSVSDYTFIIRATNGVGINTNNPGSFSLRVRGNSDLPGVTSLAVTNTANVATNLSIGSGVVFQYATNFIAVTNAGSTSANGTYQYISGAVFTNHSTACVITNNGSTWQIKSGTTVLYSSATLENSAWTIQSGASPAARSYYGSVQNMDGVVIRGYINSTNLDARLTTASTAIATNLLATYFWSTNTTEDKTRIFVTGTVTPTPARGEYRLAWTNSTGFEAVWTNTVGTNLVWMNATNDPSDASFRITDGTNSLNHLTSFTQRSLHPAGSGTVTFWENPFELTDTAYFGGAAILTWGTNYIVTNYIRYLGNGDKVVLPQHVPTNALVVSLQGDDVLAGRTNGWPFKTLQAANEANTNGGVIYVEEGNHFTYGFHMKRGTRIVGSGRSTIINPLYDDDVNHSTFFQSQLISVWDNCTVENLVITNGCIGFTQQEGTILGGTNGLIKDLWIYPAYLPTVYPEVLQPSYFGVGVKFSRLGTKNRCENVKVYTSAVGFDFQSSVNANIVSEFDLVNCEVIASPEFTGMTNYWLRTGMMGFNNTNIGGMMPIAFSLGDTNIAYNRSPITLNIVGGRYHSVNGGTNLAVYVGGETNTSRNAAIWIARGHTNQVRINFSNNPEFGHGTTNLNARSYFILNEATNNNIAFSGTASVKAFTNGDRNSAGTNQMVFFETEAPMFDPQTNAIIANISQSVYAAGTVATSTSSTNTMDFGTTDPTLTIVKKGTYNLRAAAGGIAVPDSGAIMYLLLQTNNVTATVRTYQTDVNMAGFVLPWYVAVPDAIVNLNAGDTVALKWYVDTGTDFQGQSAEVSAIRLR